MTNEEIKKEIETIQKMVTDITLAYEMAHRANLATAEFMVTNGYPADHPVMIANVEAISKAK